MATGTGDGAGRPVFWNGFANMASLQPVVIEGGEGVTVVDTEGRRYLDAIASLWYANVGHGRKELADTAAAQMSNVAATPPAQRTKPAFYQTCEPFSNPPAEALARRVAQIAPLDDAKVFFT